MALNEKNIAELVFSRIGLNPDTIGRKMIEAKFKKIVDHYGSELPSKQHLIDELSEEAVVIETWFMRDESAFDYLGQAAGKLLKSKEKLKILSAPCASGEEPYSIAMTLFDAGISAEKFSIDALDISRTALKKANSGVYGESSFRNVKAKRLQAKYFHKISNSYKIKESVKKTCSFKESNILEFQPFATNTYDIVFCRNLLIYLSLPARKKLISNLKRLMNNEALLFAGHSEISHFAQEGFVRLKERNAFVCKLPGMKESISSQTKPFPKAKFPKRRIPRPLAPETEPETPDFQPDQIPTKKIDIETIMKIADSGDLAEAKRLCSELLETDKLNYEPYQILGLIEMAENNLNSAVKCFEKAIYLKPDDLKSLVKLSLVYESLGKSQKSEIYKKRAERIKIRQENNG